MMKRDNRDQKQHTRRAEHGCVTHRQGGAVANAHQVQRMNGTQGGPGRAHVDDHHQYRQFASTQQLMRRLTMQRGLLLSISPIRALLLPVIHWWWRAAGPVLSATGAATRSLASSAGGILNRVLSFVVFTLLDLLDALLCLVYRLADYTLESEWRPCYCGSSSSGGAKGMVTSSGNILVSEDGGSKVVCLSSSNRLHLDDISDTLYWRPPLLAEVGASAVRRFRRIMPGKPAATKNGAAGTGAGAGAFRSAASMAASGSSSASSTTLRINSTIVEMLQGKMGRRQYSHPVAPRWSDCDCKTCSSWIHSSPDTLYVHVEGPKDVDNTVEDVLFIHGFISSSLFWTETVFPSLSDRAKSRYRLFAVDLLGFGRSPKPADSLYTLREHVDMIERSVLQAHGLRSFHIVAHSLGSILALALAVKHPDAVKSLTMIAPPYFPVPKGEASSAGGGGVAQYMLRKVAPRRVWPPIAFGASVACWYEHISRTVCLVICKHHRRWESAFRRITFNRIRTFLMDGFFCHSHNAAWHTVHNIICGSAGKVERYLDVLSRRMPCDVTVLHGRGDEVLPVECSLAVGRKVPRAEVRVVEGVDHITVVVGRRQAAFARELEDIWDKSSLAWASARVEVSGSVRSKQQQQ